MPLFGAQYYLKLRRQCHLELQQLNQKLTRPALFEKMWSAHSQKPAVASLDGIAKREEEETISGVIEGLGFRLPYKRPSTTVNEIRSLIRRAEAMPETEYTTESFTAIFETLLALSKGGHRLGIPMDELNRVKWFCEKIQAKGYRLVCNSKGRVLKQGRKRFAVNGDGLPRNYVTSHFESSRRKH